MSAKRLAATSPASADVGGKRRCVEGGTTRISFSGFCVEASLHGDKGVRRQMEDEHLVLPSLAEIEPSLKPTRDYAIFAVFDGHGGRQSAAFVKSVLPSEVATQQKLFIEKQQQQNEDNQMQQKSFIKKETNATDTSSNTNSSNNSSNSNNNNSSNSNSSNSNSGCCVSDKEIKHVLYAAFKKVDSRIATEIPACRDGCTAVFLMMLGRQVFVAALGDSAAYLARKHETGYYAIPLTETHRPYLLVEKERILKMGGAIEGGRVNGALEVTRSFGDISLKRYGVSCVPTLKKLVLDLSKDAFILLGCDGFWGAWGASEAVEKAAEFIEKEKRNAKINSRPFEPAAVCRQLVDFVLIDRKAQDNVSVLLIRLIEETENKSSAKEET